jgi:hypothetical protein
VVEPRVDDALRVDHGARDVVARLPPDPPARAGVDEAVLRARVEGVAPTDELGWSTTLRCCAPGVRRSGSAPTSRGRACARIPAAATPPTDRAAHARRGARCRTRRRSTRPRAG